MKLLERARTINAMLQKTSKSVDFNDMSATLRDVISANIFILEPPWKVAWICHQAGN